jgi:hypothetical protein
MGSCWCLCVLMLVLACVVMLEGKGWKEGWKCVGWVLLVAVCGWGGDGGMKKGWHNYV